MKALVSRESHRPEQRYSGVYHVQGAMVTDADLDERSDITRARTDNLGGDAVGTGVPANGGAVVLAEGQKPRLQPGVIYADGVRGVLAAAGKLDPDNPLAIFTAQADLPFGPALPVAGDHILYADIWERPVFPLEDPYLADPGLHGAVTAFRTRTMTQVKAAPAAETEHIRNGTGPFPRVGTGRLSVKLLDAEVLADDCDPCADVVPAEQTVANTLWRIEVIAITGSADAPGEIVLAWSEENAAEIAPAAFLPATFARPNKVYEFFSPITEARAGVHADAGAARQPAFTNDLGVAPVPPTDHDGNPWPFVRRWDGHATIDSASGKVMAKLGGGYVISAAVRTVTLRVGAFEATLDFTGAAVVPGDYWLVETRRHAAETNRIRAVSETPVGILHHYCTLLKVSGGALVEPDDATRRRLSFPSLAALPADHVGFDNNCAKLYGGAENVQEALDNLCGISAEDIGFAPACESVFGDAKTVQEAFDALCHSDFSVRDSFRLLFDWGVVCGIVPRLAKLNSGLIKISPGAYLDRTGRLTKFDGIEIDLAKLKLGREIVFETEDAFQKALTSGKVCLALSAADGGKTRIHLIPESIAYGPADPGFSERVRACAAKKPALVIDDLVGKLNEKQKLAATKVFLASSGDGAFRASAKLTRAEFQEAEAVNEALSKAFADVAEADETEQLKARIEEARKANPVGNLTGAALEVRLMQQATAVYAAFAESDQQRLQRCICENLLPPCPPDPGEPPHYVPIACLTGSSDPPILVLRDVCEHCCRKQAMTWRSMEYFFGDMRRRVSERLKALCCAPPAKVPEPGLLFDKKWFEEFDAARLVTDLKLDKAFLNVPDKLPTDFVTKVTVNDLSTKDAVATLKGTGIEVAETIDINDAKAFDVIQSKLQGVSPTEILASAGNVRPGDKVGLLVQNGVARGYVLLERGSGKLPFEAATLRQAVAVTDDDLKRSEELVRQAEAVRIDLAVLEKSRDTLATDIANLKAEAGTLAGERDAAAEAVSKARTDLAELARTRATLSDEIASAMKELEAVEANRKVLAGAIRESQPVNAVIGNDNPELAAKLAGAGVTDVAAMSKLTAADIRKLVSAGIVRDTAEGTELRTRATDFLKPR